MKQLNSCLTNQQEDILAEKINLNHTWNRESVRKPYTRKQRGFHNIMLTVTLMMSKTAWFCRR